MANAAATPPLRLTLVTVEALAAAELAGATDVAVFEAAAEFCEPVLTAVEFEVAALETELATVLVEVATADDATALEATTEDAVADEATALEATAEVAVADDAMALEATAEVAVADDATVEVALKSAVLTPGMLIVWPATIKLASANLLALTIESIDT